MDTNPAAIGHNSRALSLAELLDPEILIEQMKLDHAGALERADALIQSDVKMRALLRSSPDMDDDTAGRVGDLVGKIKAHAKALATLHETLKDPILQAGRAIDAMWKKNGVDRLKEVAAKIEVEILTPFQEAKLKRERAAAAEVALRLREEAERIQREADDAAAVAERTMHPELIENASSAQISAEIAGSTADRAERRVGSGDAALSRTRGAASSTTLAEVWKWRITNFADIPHDYLEVSPQRLNAAIKAGARDIAGIEIYSEKKAIVR